MVQFCVRNWGLKRQLSEGQTIDFILLWPDASSFASAQGVSMLSWIKQLIGQPARDYEERFDQASKRSKSWDLAPSGFRRTDKHVRADAELTHIPAPS